LLIFQLKNVGALDIPAFALYLENGKIDLNPAGTKHENVLKWLNAVFRADPASRMTTRPNSNAFFSRSKGTTMILQSTGGLVEARRGFFQSAQIRFSRMTLNIDTATTPFWVSDKPLIECICGLMGGLRPDALEREFKKDPAHFFAVCSKLLGMRFVVKHIPGQNDRKIKFIGWSSKDSRNTMFERQSETGTESTSVFDYFKSKYGILDGFSSLPLVHSMRGDFPLQVCYSAADERYRSVLEGAETADFIRFATAPATVRRQQIDSFNRMLAWHNQPLIQAHGLSVSTKQLPVKALVLPGPQIQYAAQAIRPQNGQWSLRGGLTFVRPSTIKSWVLVSFIASSQVQRFGEELLKGLRTVGLSVPSDPPAILVENAQGDIRQIVNNAVQKAEQHFSGSTPDLILAILPKSSVSLYTALKSALDIHYGIASQVMLAEKALKERGQAQYIANIAMKVNVKLGGTNCTIDEPLFKKDRYMLIGGDLSLAGPSATRRDPVPPASSALVGTWDRSCTAYTSISSMQPSTYVNIVVNAALMFKELLIRYKERNNGLLPQRIIYYRDGASESEFDGILKQEGLALRALCKDSGTKITIVVAIKRHHTRFFAEGELATQLGNVPPGTVIENSPDRNDCFIVSHKDLQGTKRPTFYRVLVDENALTADDFNRLTYGLCSTYARATTSVAVWLVSECVIAIWTDLLIL
jgi:eukaryotic translation initiation factor 2C